VTTRVLKKKVIMVDGGVVGEGKGITLILCSRFRNRGFNPRWGLASPLYR